MPHQQIILFDGVCNFCNFWVNFIIKRDKKDIYRFAAIQSATGQRILNVIGMSDTIIQTLILVDGKNYYIKSTAALKVIKNLSGPIKTLYPFILLPKFLRDFFYNAVAGYRYKIFGKRDACRVPTTEEREKFL
jgi:predicted DCC family thiol-disulfide oxidoreductase YuxK